MNEVVDPEKMDEKWARELQYIHLMSNEYSDLVPKIKQIDLINKKIYLEIDGSDFWEQAGCLTENYDSVLPDWQDQMLEIIKAHRALDLYKFSMHPSSYFIVDGQLKSINYFFCYNNASAPISLRSVMSHISEDRQADLFPKMLALGIDVDAPTPHDQIQQLAFESFKTNFPADFMDKCKQLYV
jgi:hypothetical protein